MFYKIGYSDDVLQYHMSNGDAESMRDLKFMMNKFSGDVDNGQYLISKSIPENLRNVMYSAKNNLQRSFMLRKNGNYSEIQQMLPEGVKYWSYQGIYDPNDDIAPDYYQNKQNESGYYGSIGVYGQ